MKLKKIISSVLCGAMLASTALIGVTSVTAADELPFDDVPAKWFKNAVVTVYNEGIMQGKSDTKFDPTANITRAEVVTAFARIACTNIDGKGDALTFTDTKTGKWYSDSVGWAADNGIVKGRGDGRFSPSDNITRAELASIIINFVNYMGLKLPDNPKIDKFSDVGTFANWMKEPVEAVRKTGLMQGVDGKFNPKGNATRAEIAQVIANLLPSTGRVNVVENGKTDYVIVIDEANSAAVDAAERIVWQLEETTGASIKVVDDSTKAVAKEIVLGTTDRGAKVDTADFIKDSYGIAVDGEKIYIDGSSADGLYGGAVDFMNTCTSNDDLRFTVKTAAEELFKYPVGKLTIAGNDISKYTVYYPEDADADCISAAEAVSENIEKACGVKVPVKSGTAANYGIIIKYVASDKTFDDSFTVKSEGTNIVISGHRDRGAILGAYDFLEECLGVRFISLQNTSNVYIVEAESIELADINYTEKPYFTYRVSTTGRSPAAKLWRDLSWATPNCHSFGYLMADDPFIDDSYLPDVYPCLTSEADRTKILNNLDRYINRHIERNGTPPDIVDLGYTDNALYCQCESCEEINNKYQSPAATLVLYMNDVCEYYADKYPDMKIQTLAYWHTLDAPVGLKAHPNVVVQYCTISNCYNHPLDYDCYFNRTANEQINGWAQVADELHIWDYGYNWAYSCTPYPILSYEDIMGKHQFFYENNVNLIFQCIESGYYGNFQQLCTYLYHLAMWDPYMSENEYYSFMQEACMGLYGEGWEYVYETINSLEEKYNRCLISEQSPASAMMHLYMRSYYDEMIANMKEARLLATTKAQWDNTNCAMIQFEWVKIDSEFDTLYNSSNKEDNELLQEMCHELYEKILMYPGCNLSLNSPNPPMPEIFKAKPSEWKNWAIWCENPNGDEYTDDKLYDENGNWLDEKFGWENWE